MRAFWEVKITSNPSVYRKLHREQINNREGMCHFCPPHGGENRTRSYRHPIKKQWQLNRDRGFKRIRITNIKEGSLV